MHDEPSSSSVTRRSAARELARRTGPLSVVLFALPLVLGARGCERRPDPCEGDNCAPGGEAGGPGGMAGGGNTAGRGGAGGSGGGEGCSYNGQHYDVGEGFPSDDGCNTCSCMDSGVSCTLRACAAGGDAASGGSGGGGGGSGDGGGGGGGSGGVGGGDGEACGGLTGLPCEDGEFCNYAPEAQCGAADQAGTCMQIPQACTQQYDPVCGCDDATYGNDCEAAAAGVSIIRKGECEDSGSGSGQTCGGIASLECPSGDEFCNYEESAGGQGCDGTISDAGGVCQTRPGACTREYAPVCGCDRRSYDNDCTAHAAGASVLRERECTELDCESIGGHAQVGAGPAPVCPSGETDWGWIRFSNGTIAIEGAICCVP